MAVWVPGSIMVPIIHCPVTADRGLLRLTLIQWIFFAEAAFAIKGEKNGLNYYMGIDCCKTIL